jgi:short-subunit dehydrogenase
MDKKGAFTLALVTGATSGIGSALARLLANKGIPLIIHGRDVAKLELLGRELSPLVSIDILSADLSTTEGLARMVACIAERMPDLLINNAGFGLYGHVLDYEIEEQLQLLHVNAEAVVRLSIACAGQLKAHGCRGVIMNISSVAAFPIAPRLALYSASKVLVNQFSESFDYEMRPHGIRVLVSCPGVVETNFRARASRGRGTSSLSWLLSRMTSTKEEAAAEIWRQIRRQQKVHIFNRFYRLITWCVRYVLPKALVAAAMDRSVAQLEE